MVLVVGIAVVVAAAAIIVIAAAVVATATRLLRTLLMTWPGGVDNTLHRWTALYSE